MHKDARLKAPVFEIGLKGYVYGAEAVRLAREADRLSHQYGVTVIFDPQHVDIPAVARETQHLLVFAQHMDPVKVGRGAGSVLPEAIKEAGAVGTMLNHSERRMTLAEIYRAIKRADEVGLATMVCADSPEEAAAIAQLGPNIVLAEPPELKLVTQVGRAASADATCFTQLPHQPPFEYPPNHLKSPQRQPCRCAYLTYGLWFSPPNLHNF